MKLTVFFLLSIAIAIPSHASSRNVDLSDYIDLGTMKIGKNTKTFPNVVLPYIKPEGITEIWTPDRATLYIEKFIVDGKRVGAGLPNWGAAEEIYDEIRAETVPKEEETREFDMVWSEYGLDGSQPYITYVVYGIGWYQNSRTYVIGVWSKGSLYGITASPIQKQAVYGKDIFSANLRG